ncbi:MAG TPA: ATP-binding protein [Nitriliruptorales bacterium]|nr:ATP-binding protein [Nitriliruptorales bacterium]
MADRPWWGHWSLRTRIVAVATVLVTVVLVVGGLLLGWAMRTALVDELRQAAVLRAHDLAALAADGTLPTPIPVGDADEALVQAVVDASVIAASANADGLPPLDVGRPPAGETVLLQMRQLPLPDEHDEGFVVAATTVATDDGAVTVYVASSLEDIGETLTLTAGIAIVGLPLLIATLAGVMWLLVGRTLAPVEAIGAEADEISGRDLHRRVPEPPTDDEIGRLAHTLNRMLARLQTAYDRQRRFVADAAHELRTPLASVRTRLETVRTTHRGVDWDDVTDDLLAETTRLQQLTEQLLLLARADTGSLAATPQPVDLDDLIVCVARTYRDEPDLHIDLASVRPVQIHGDPILLEQAIRNLVDNAHQHAHSQIVISLAVEDDHAMLTVDDDGPGIPAHQRAAVFERFTRLDQARTRSRGGAGLGLAIVADIITAHHGDVQIIDNPAGGTRVQIRLPGTQSA